MIKFQIQDLENFEEVNLEDTYTIFGGCGCSHGGDDYKEGQTMVSGGKKYRCKEKNGEYEWKRVYSFGEIVSMFGTALRFKEALD